MVRVISGPVIIGNVFGFYGHTVPADHWVIVERGEYSNGGRGSSTVDGVLYPSRESAESRLCELVGQPE